MGSDNSCNGEHLHKQLSLCSTSGRLESQLFRHCCCSTRSCCSCRSIFSSQLTCFSKSLLIKLIDPAHEHITTLEPGRWRKELPLPVKLCWTPLSSCLVTLEQRQRAHADSNESVCVMKSVCVNRHTVFSYEVLSFRNRSPRTKCGGGVGDQTEMDPTRPAEKKLQLQQQAVELVA